VKRLLGAIIAAVLVGGVVFASANTLSITGQTIQAGESINLTCTDSATTHWGLDADDNLVYYVRFDGINSDCTGMTMYASVQINGTTWLQHMTATYPTSDSQVKFNFPTPLDPAIITGVRLFIQG
jgi:hypothetical protein